MKTTNTSRTATEQLLVSDAIDKAINDLNFSILAGKKVFLNVDAISGVTDTKYLSSSIRQQLLATGAIIQEDKTKADYIVEVRCGGVGTDEQSVVYGIPELTTPTFVTGSSISIPELAIAKKLGQNAFCNLAVFAWNRETGMPLWQSGTCQESSGVKSLWVMGAGPYRTGDIIERPEFASSKVDIPLVDHWQNKQDATRITVRDQAYFVENNTAKSEKSDMPVLRLKAPQDTTLEVSGMVSRPEGLYIPPSEKLVGFQQPGTANVAGNAQPAQAMPASIAQAPVGQAPVGQAPVAQVPVGQVPVGQPAYPPLPVYSAVEPVDAMATQPTNPVR